MKTVLIFALLINTSFCFGQLSKNKYKIVHSEKDSKGLINSLDVLVPNMSVIKSVNKQLFDKYKNTGIVTFQIYYFDDLKVALMYRKVIFDKNLSDEKLDKMAQHLIGKFEYNSYLNPNQSLKIGRDADMI
ncbi:hypothetical protein [Mucilaginibacter sp.]|uniref:hypothetical protein n=1 Tax=Mucilaginibacter sp. TaxID=1882438 RepID=UPI003D10B37B